MKNKLFYLFGAAFLLCSISTFTACSDDENEPVVEVPGDDDGKDDDGKGDDGKDDKLNLSGEYFAGNAKALKMTYNGEELSGRKVIVEADEENQKASITLEGIEKDLGATLGGLINLKLKPYSPVPGEEKITLSNIELTPNADATEYTFKGEDRNATRTTTFNGTIKDGEMSIEISNELASNTLAGTWELPVKFSLWEGITCVNSAPLWIDWDSYVEINPGEIEAGGQTITGLNQNPNSLFTWILVMLATPGMSDLGIDITVEQWIANMLNSITAQPNGCMYAKYSYSGDINNPQWSEEMSHNIIRYYYGEEPDQVYIEANIDFILNALTGLLAPTTRAESDINEIITPLIETLKPALEKGFPCTYKINGDNMMINLDGTFTLNLLKNLVTVLNEPTINMLVMSMIEEDATLKPYAPNIKLLLESLPNALTYKGSEGNPKDLSGECTFVKIGLQLVKTAE